MGLGYSEISYKHRLWPFFWLKIVNFRIFGVFRNVNIVWDMMKLWNFFFFFWGGGVHHKTGFFGEEGGHFYTL